MERAPQPSLTIRPVKRGDEAAALGLVFRGLVDKEQLDRTDELLAGGSPDDLLGAYRDGALVGAIYFQKQPGRVALVWYPRLVKGEVASTAVGLLDATRRRLRQQQFQLAQCLLRDVTATEEMVLQKSEFAPLAKLYYLVCGEESFPRDNPQGELTFEPLCSANRDGLQALIDATYQGTLDCPAMNGVRPTAEVLEGYKASGVFDPSRWLLVSHAGQSAGCLLLTDYPDQENWELIYMGLRPEFRGRGWGLVIARYAQWLVRQAGRRRLVLAVDAQNAPALRMYTAAGFRAWDRRRVFVWHGADNHARVTTDSPA